MRPAPLVLLALVAACGTAATTSSFSTMSSPGTGSMLNVAALGVVNGETLFETLSRRSPMLLRPRAGTTVFGPEEPLGVFLDGTFIGEVDALKMVFTREVLSVQKFSPSEASVRYGPLHRNGVLVVTTLRRR
jgi:hypothetical protein